MGDHQYYNELINMFKDYGDTFNALYRLRSNEGEEISSIFRQIKTNLIETSYFSASYMIDIIKNIILYNNRYVKGYKSIMTQICEEFHLNKHNFIQSIPDIHEDNTVYNAIMNDDKESLILFTLQEGFNENEKLKFNMYPIQNYPYSLIDLCCYYGSVNCFKLLRTKYDSKISRVSLYNSFLGGNLDIISECMKEQQINHCCLQYAIASHNIDFVTFITNEHDFSSYLDYCCRYHNINAYLIYLDQTNDFNECFIYSPSFKIPYLTEFLFSHVSDINVMNKNLETALCYAAMVDNKSAAEFLITHGADMIFNGKSFRNSVLNIAAKFNSVETADLLISYGADANLKYNQELTALHTAAVNNSKETAELLIANGAEIHAKTCQNYNALHFAAEKNNVEIAKLLIVNGIDVNAVENNYKKTALHYAAENGCEELVKFLICYGADINIRDRLDFTPLHYAAGNGNKEIVQTLLLHGADINAKGFHDVTPLCKAISKNNQEITNFLISKGAKVLL